MARRAVTGLHLISRLQDELDRAFARAGEVAPDDRRGGDLAPPIDVLETEEAIVIILEAPGFATGDLRIETSGNRLSIRGRRRAVSPRDAPIRFFCMECRHGEFERHIELVGALDSHRARARLAKGLLRIEIPKITDRRLEPRLVEIEAEDGT